MPSRVNAHLPMAHSSLSAGVAIAAFVQGSRDPRLAILAVPPLLVGGPSLTEKTARDTHEGHNEKIRSAERVQTKMSNPPRLGKL